MKSYLVFGAGEQAHRNLTLFQKLSIANKVEILAFIDNDRKKWGNKIDEIPIISPEEISKYTYDGISIWSSYKEAIGKQLIFELQIPIEKINDLMTLFLDEVCVKYDKHPEKEIQDILKIMKERGKVEVFYFKEKAKWTPYEAYYDAEKDFYYILFEGKRVYIKKGIELQVVGERKFFRDIWYEQDENSPHLYEEGDICVKQGDIILDVGACEGNFTLHNIDKIKKGYVVECDPEWVKALRYTFEPYKNKIEIIEAYVGEADAENTKKLDTICKDKINFLKMDIEGAEIAALKGAKKLFQKSTDLKCSICAYHRHNDETEIKKILHEYGITTSVSKGYMLFVYDQKVREKPELRRGIVRGSRQTKGEYERL